MNTICDTMLTDNILAHGTVSCTRNADHAGKHQGFTPNKDSFPLTYRDIRWHEDDGASAYLESPLLWNECDRCEILISEKAIQCEDCDLEDRLHDIITEHHDEMIIFNGNIFIEVEKKSTNWKPSMTVIWKDKTKIPLVSSYLSNVTGPMPKKYRDAFPDNAIMKETVHPAGFVIAA